MEHKPTPHPQAEFIAEWIKDTSRKVEFKSTAHGYGPDDWAPWDGPLNISGLVVYRFKPETLRYRVALQKRNLDASCKPTPMACWDQHIIEDENGVGIVRFIRWLDDVKEVEL